MKANIQGKDTQVSLVFSHYVWGSGGSCRCYATKGGYYVTWGGQFDDADFYPTKRAARQAIFWMVRNHPNYDVGSGFQEPRTNSQYKRVLGW
jgi:hypothetical protein